MDTADIIGSPAEQLRTTRLIHGSACDTCRRRRVKCDGNQPCDRCTKSGIACSYGSSASRASSVSYARQLEQRVVELQRLLAEQTQAESGENASQAAQSQTAVRRQSIDTLIGPGDDYIHRMSESSSNTFYGRFGGLSILRSVGDMIVPLPATAQVSSPGRSLIESFEVAALSHPTTVEATLLAILPSKQRVQELVDHALRTAFICHDCLDHVQLPIQLDRLYDTNPEDYSANDKEFLALLYILVALGRRYSPSMAGDEIDESSNKVKLKGLQYFNASLDIIQTIDAHGLDSIRAIICQARYLMSASMMSKAYSRICIGISAALRMGLHVPSSALSTSFSNEELLQRRRVFAILNMMDTYLSSLLGFPKTLRSVDVTQSLGLRDEDLADEGQNFISQNPTTSAAETVLCEKLNIILAKMNDARFSSSASSLQSSKDFFEDDNEARTMWETEIQEWHNELPAMLEGTTDIRVLQAQLQLRLWHSLAQIILYRPFLHHLARDRQDPKFNIRGYECGSACVRAAMQGVWVIEAFRTNNILHEGYWLNMYMLGFSASILTYFVTSTMQRTTVEESIVAAWKANDMLAHLGKYNISAKRYSNSLKAITSMLPVMTEGLA